MKRRTRSQIQVLKQLKKLKEPKSAQDIYVHLRQQNVSMGLATVYRALDALKLEGAIQVRTLPSGESLYSLAQAEDTHHLTCVRCGVSSCRLPRPRACFDALSCDGSAWHTCGPLVGRREYVHHCVYPPVGECGRLPTERRGTDCRVWPLGDLLVPRA